ncbi:glucan phosphoethanolaminetransferase (alkaline phosphatase superfamily) [Mesocricetibacter intestinalis]|uniref:Glucan phosphoethanolaminetransferase (Alkaline phosphatase superfamily) n=1 Tax=Mesocricetibacter intestinalis TaxID=1521930 RepID=A0A4R6VHC7_9PAST|nr:phosphoethanolamine transferase [Mesocricetibacter intestinalis]TDQ57628.1 glucan phosphoethanolaminetransferase (alkaline phosphatase superfamily) [Mesocricetibacter intestinalis]
MLKRFYRYLAQRFFYLWLLWFSFLTVVTSPEKSIYYAVLSTYILYYLLYVANKRFFFIAVMIITLSLCLYYPVYLRYSSLNSGIVAAFFETNPEESFAFIKELDLSHFVIPLLFLLSAVLLFRLEKYNKPAQDNKKILHGVLFVVLIFSIVWIPIKSYFNQQKGLEQARWSLTDSPVNLVSFYANIYASISGYYQEKQELENVTHITPPWKISAVNPQYRNYVLVIGESARKDWISSYGFNLPTTPFLDGSKGYINSGYIAAAPGTYHSLLYSLYFTDPKVKKVNYAYNIITLAKAAGIHTVWLSNQGRMGKYDTVASRIGASAHRHQFTKVGAFNMGGVDDDKLVEMLEQELAYQTPEANRLFVLHLMGSHANFCDRVNNKISIEFINKSLSCYASSILKTDKLIEKVIGLLRQKDESYSLLYFSDHGLSYVDKESKEKLSLDHGCEFKQNYEVPFFKLSSDDTRRREVNVRRSGMKFIYGFAQWLGIQTQELADYDFFSDQNDTEIKVFNFEKEISFDQLKEDILPDYR